MPLRRPSPPLDSKAGPFVAIDFETADYGADSACAIALVRVENGEVVERVVSLIRQPRPRVLFTHIHGITWKMVANLPVFAEVWPTVKGIVDGAHFLAAHNASFDRKVLLTCCAAAGLVAPALPFLCTVRMARQRWGEKPNNLPSVCRRLGIALQHHDPLSDAEACAQIVLAATAKLESRSAVKTKSVS